MPESQPQLATLLKKRLWHRFFCCEFCELSKNIFFTEHLWATASAGLSISEPLRVSSTKILYVEVMSSGRSFMYTRNKRGPNTEHCGNPELIFLHADIWPCKGWVTYRFSYAMRHNDARGWGEVGGWVIANDALKKRKFVEFQSSWIAVYYKIHFCVLLQPICAGEVSVVIVLDKKCNLFSSSKRNTVVRTKNIENVQFMDLAKLLTLIQIDFFQFLSKFRIYPWDKHSLKNNIGVNRSSYVVNK